MRTLGLISTGAMASALLAIASLPAVAQERPESILPPGYSPSTGEGSDSSPPPPGDANQPPVRETVRVPGRGDTPDVELSIPAERSTSEPSSRASAAGTGEEEDDPDADLADLPELTFTPEPVAARSLSDAGLIGPDAGGFAPNALGARPGRYVHALITHIDAPLMSRWATIMGRRLLASRLETPAGMSGQQFVADRTWLLLKMGEANVARALLQQVDTQKFTSPLYRISLPTYLAAVDPAGACPLVNGGVDATGDNDWKMMRSICASFAGEQSRADALFSSARRQGTARGIDLLLAEKLLGVSSRRRAVELEWDDVEGFSAWRHGMALAAGVEPPSRLYETSGRQTRGWLAVAPSLPASARAEPAITAAALGNLSNAALVSLYAEAAMNEESPDSVLGRAAALGTAYRSSTRAARMAAMRQFMPGDEEGLTAERYGELVLVSRAAAAIAPSADLDEDVKGWLIAAMLTSGLDRQAARWRGAVDPGSLGWALVMAAAPRTGAIDTGAVEDFVDSYGEASPQKARLFAAGLAGLGRLETATLVDLGDSLGTNFAARSAFTQAIRSAVEARQPGIVALYAMAALQGKNWSTVSPAHFYHLVRALRLTGREAEARMIVAEAVTRA